MTKSSVRVINLRKSVLLLSLGTLICLSAQPGYAGQHYTITDFDGPLLHRKATRYVLQRIQHRAFVSEVAPQGPESIEISREDYDLLASHGAFARGDREVGSQSVKIQLPQGETVESSHYFLDPRLGYKYFRKTPSGEPRPYVVRDFNQLSPEEQRSPLLFKIMQFQLSSPARAQRLGTLTAREEVFPYFTNLHEQKLIGYLPDPRLMNELGLDQFDYLGRERGLPSMKVARLEEIVEQISKEPCNEETDHQVMTPDGYDSAGNKQYGHYHTLVVPEDENPNLEAIHQYFQKIASTKPWKRWSGKPVKLVLLHAGSKAEVAQTARPRYSVYDSLGNPRPATLEEVLDIGPNEQLTGQQEQFAREIAAQMKEESEIPLEANWNFTTLPESIRGYVR